MASYNEMGGFICMNICDHNFWKQQVIFQCLSIILIQVHLSEKSSVLQPQVGILDSFVTSKNVGLVTFSYNFLQILISL